jgi:hypothetical protein
VVGSDLVPPSAPWRLVAEVVLAWVPSSRLAGWRSLLPSGIRPLPGPAALVGVRYDDSPVGPYLELSLALPARLGLRPGLCVVFQVLSLPAARVAYRSNWGLPADVGQISWEVAGHERIVRCEAPGLELRGTPVGPGVPAIVPVRSVQRRADGPVVLPRRFLALVRLARTAVVVDDEPGGGDLGVGVGAGAGAGGRVSFGALAGTHPGAVMAGARILARPARHPFGLWSSLRAPLVVPEPALLTGGRAEPRYSGAPHRALSSVG